MSSVRNIAVAVPGSRHQLDARLTRPGSSTSAALAIVAPPHPLFGGTTGNPVVRAIEKAYLAAQVATLAFNFRGTGESTGEPSGEPAEALVDYLAVARSQPAQPVSLSGYSFGSATALRAAVELDVAHVVLVGPPLGMLDDELLARYRGRLLVVAGDDDEYAPASELRTLFGARANTSLALIEGAEHFFLGSSILPLLSTLTKVLEGELAQGNLR